MRSRISIFVLALAVGFTALPASAQKKPAKKAEKAAVADEPPPAPPPPPSLSETLTGNAKSEYEAGRLLFEDGDYPGATLKFAKAYDLSKDPRLLWNVAAAEKNLRHYSKVIVALERYIAEGDDKLSDQDRADAKQLIDTVSAFVGTLDISIDPSDADVSLDDEPIGKSPLAGPLRVDHGSHVLRVKKEGFEDYTVRPKITGGETQKLQIVLKPVVHEGRLRVVAGRGDTISVDGRVVGKGTWEGKLDSGQHSLSVTAPGKQARQLDVMVNDGKLSTSHVVLQSATLTKEKDSGFFGGPWPWVIGGAVLATGAGVGAYFLLKPEDEPAPAPVGGSLNPGTVRLPVRF